MKILHVCLANFYIDNYSYQENLLTKYHKKMGLDVDILASLVSFDENGRLCLLTDSGTYVNENNIPVTRLQYKDALFSKRLRRYSGTYQAICASKPDIIFIHGCQFADIKQIIRYIKKNTKVTVYVDSHSDFSNSASNFLSKNILHRIIWRYCAQQIEPYTTKFYGVLPARVAFLNEMYAIPREKIELLVMGLDDERIKNSNPPLIIEKIREKYSIDVNDFLIVTGGKIDFAKKQTLLLMEAVHKINKSDVRLIVFGPIISELKDSVIELADGLKVQYIGALSPAESNDIFMAADLAAFPGRHSVFWEQVVGLGIPLMAKYWEGTTHVDLGGNCEFLYHDDVEEIIDKINKISEPDKLRAMKKAANGEKQKAFFYSQIAIRSIREAVDSKG